MSIFPCARWNDLLLMKTASLGLLEVMVVRVNAGGDAHPNLEF